MRRRGCGRGQRRRVLSARTLMTTVAGRMVAQGEADIEKRQMRFAGRTPEAPEARFSGYLASGLSRKKGMQFEERIRRHRRVFMGVCSVAFAYWLLYLLTMG